MTTTASDIYYDPYDYVIDANPHPIWKRMRDECPVYYNERYDFYALSRYDDVRDASRDWQTFSSAKGSVLEIIRSPETFDGAQNLLFMDPPEHDQNRALIGRRFTPRQVAKMNDDIRRICAGYLDPYVGSSGFDFVQDFGALIPMMVICSFMGLPSEDRDAVRMMADATLHREEGQTEAPVESITQMARYIDGAIAIRQFRRRQDFISELIDARLTLEDGSQRHLDPGELIRFLALVAGGGNETVARLMSWSGALLAHHPEQRRLLVDTPALIPQAIEEIIRYEAPSPVQARVTTREVALHGTTIPAGAVVLLLTNSANRDERAFPDADRFDVTREPHPHVAFGFGVHFCVGASLARLESRVALEETLKRFPTWEVDWERAERVHTSTVRGFHKLPILL
ncbi:MAG: cytochrome P450 [Acidimicrobiales bacterium]